MMRKCSICKEYTNYHTNLCYICYHSAHKCISCDNIVYNKIYYEQDEYKNLSKNFRRFYTDKCGKCYYLSIPYNIRKRENNIKHDCIVMKDEIKKKEEIKEVKKESKQLTLDNFFKKK